MTMITMILMTMTHYTLPMIRFDEDKDDDDDDHNDDDDTNDVIHHP